jgi:hypothetical protein
MNHVQEKEYVVNALPITEEAVSFLRAIFLQMWKEHMTDRLKGLFQSLNKYYIVTLLILKIRIIYE